jgi:DNA-binding response OmpR family regulator
MMRVAKNEPVTLPRRQSASRPIVVASASCVRPEDARAEVLVLGDCADDVVHLIAQAARMSAQEVAVKPTLDGAALDGTAELPTAIVVDLGARGSRGLVAAVRSRLDLAQVPIVGVASDLTDLVFEEALAAGIDDCCPRDVGALGRVLRAVSAGAAPVPRQPHAVVVADPDRHMRMLIGRVFHNAGYEVLFAIDGTDALRWADNERVQAVICSASLEAEDDDSGPLSVRARRAGSQAVWVINTPPSEIPATLAGVDVDDHKLAVHDAYTPPDNLLFVTNELLGRPGQEARLSERVLYGTIVRFRGAGQREERVGYSYNISAGGLYVRTLVPPERLSSVWIEMVPPRSDRLVHLEASVVWCRRPGPSGQATVPSGFGVRITGATPSDAQRYQEGYDKYLVERVVERMTARPPRQD